MAESSTFSRLFIIDKILDFYSIERYFNFSLLQADAVTNLGDILLNRNRSIGGAE